MAAKDGMFYAAKGKPDPVVKPGEFVFSAVGLDHGHIYGMTSGLLDAGNDAVFVLLFDFEIVLHHGRESHRCPPEYIKLKNEGARHRIATIFFKPKYRIVICR